MYNNICAKESLIPCIFYPYFIIFTYLYCQYHHIYIYISGCVHAIYVIFKKGQAKARGGVIYPGRGTYHSVPHEPVTYGSTGEPKNNNSSVAAAAVPSTTTGNPPEPTRISTTEKSVPVESTGPPTTAEKLAPVESTAPSSDTTSVTQPPPPSYSNPPK